MLSIRSETFGYRGVNIIRPVPPLLDTVSDGLLSCRETCAALANLVPPDQFWKWKDMWSISLRNAVFMATMVGYLRTGKLLTLAEVASILDSMADPSIHHSTCSRS